MPSAGRYFLSGNYYLIHQFINGGIYLQAVNKNLNYIHIVSSEVLIN